VSGVTTAYFIRLEQKITRFEIERVQMDVRDASSEDIQFLGPRIKKLLVENYNQTRGANKFFYFWCPSVVLDLILLVIGVGQSMAAEGFCIPI